MNPSTQLRIETLLRAMSESIVPSIRDDAQLAKEQAGLVMAQLSAMLTQAGREAEVREREQRLLKKLASDLIALAKGEDALAAQCKGLRQLLEAGDMAALGFAVERLLTCTEASNDFLAESARLAMDYAKLQTELARAWFLPMGFDGAPASLPDLDAQLSAKH